MHVWTFSDPLRNSNPNARKTIVVAMNTQGSEMPPLMRTHDKFKQKLFSLRCPSRNI